MILKASPTDLLIRRLYIEEQLTQVEVAVRLGLSQQKLSMLMRRHEIPRRRSGARKGYPLKNPEGRCRVLRQLAREVNEQWETRRAEILARLQAGEEMQAVARTYGMTPGGLQRRLRKLGIARAWVDLRAGDV